jgi:hypothetical protein
LVQIIPIYFHLKDVKLKHSCTMAGKKTKYAHIQ